MEIGFAIFMALLLVAAFFVVIVPPAYFFKQSEISKISISYIVAGVIISTTIVALFFFSVDMSDYLSWGRVLCVTFPGLLCGFVLKRFLGKNARKSVMCIIYGYEGLMVILCLLIFSALTAGGQENAPEMSNIIIVSEIYGLAFLAPALLFVSIL